MPTSSHPSPTNVETVVFELVAENGTLRLDKPPLPFFRDPRTFR